MDWIVYIVVALVAAGASYYSAQRAQHGNNIKPGTFQAPTAEEGRKIPKLFGTRLIKDANVVWYGDVKTEAVQK